jgi:hypothetical protein
MTQGAIKSSVDNSIQEQEMAIFLSFLGELDVAVNADTLVLAAINIFQCMRPDYKCVINIREPAPGLVGCPSSESSVKKMAITGGSGEPMVTPLICLLKQKSEKVWM